jgi:hypothetical protein
MAQTNIWSEVTIALESKLCTSGLIYEDPSEMLAIVRAIPDGVHLANFPNHLEGPDCWCRPYVIFTADMLIVSHKDLSHGDFDS